MQGKQLVFDTQLTFDWWYDACNAVTMLMTPGPRGVREARDGSCQEGRNSFLARTRNTKNSRTRRAEIPPIGVNTELRYIAMAKNQRRLALPPIDGESAIRCF